MKKSTRLSPISYPLFLYNSVTKPEHRPFTIMYGLCLFSRDLVLLKCGSWSKKIEVTKASKGEEISVNLISSEYGKPWKHLCMSHRNISTICTDILYIVVLLISVIWQFVVKHYFCYTISLSLNYCN